MYNIQPNQPNASFLLEARDVHGKHVAYYRVDQVLANHKDSKQWLNMAKAVRKGAEAGRNSHGLSFEMFHYCLKHHMDDFIVEHSIEVE